MSRGEHASHRRALLLLIIRAIFSVLLSKVRDIPQLLYRKSITHNCFIDIAKVEFDE
jgi:hypothetical protein